MEKSMDNQKEIIKLLAKHEFAISSLYKKYAEKLPEHKDFWMELSDDETDHGKCILEMQSRVEDGTISFDKDRFKVSEIERSLNLIEEMQQDVDKPDFEMKNALSAAQFLEESMIENKHFEVFNGDGPAFTQVLKLLAEATAEHKERVRTKMEKC
jgi:hypothetical protein